MAKVTIEVRRERTGKIHLVSSKRLREMLRQYIPRGRFLAREGRKWVALDNSTYDAWMEKFPRKHQAVRWLWGKFEVGDKAEQRTSMDGRIVCLPLEVN